MQTCLRCGFHHSDKDVKCVRCGALLRDQGRLDPLAALGEEPVDLRPVRGIPGLNVLTHGIAALRRGYYFVRRGLQSTLPDDVHFRNPWIAGALGLVPGLGQLYNHQPKRAVLLFLFIGGFIALGVLTWYQPASNKFLLAAILVWLYGFHDAFMTAKAINRDVTYWTTSVAFYLAWVFFICITVLAGQLFFGIFLIKFRYLFHDEMAPLMRKGERIALNRWHYIWHKPRIGDVAYVTNYGLPPRVLELERPRGVQSETVLVRPRNYIERVVGAPGDVLERRNGEFFRNGKSIPIDEQPIVQQQIPLNFTIVAPQDKYIILMSYTGEDIDPTMALVLGSSHTRAPRMNEGWIAQNWAQQNLVPLDDIEARVWFVYQPPPARRWIK